MPQISVCLPVKYLREVTPYFRKASIISEVGWELQRGYMADAPPSPPSPRRRRADTRYVPLLMACVARNLRNHDPGTCAPLIMMMATAPTSFDITKHLPIRALTS